MFKFCATWSCLFQQVSDYEESEEEEVAGVDSDGDEEVMGEEEEYNFEQHF